MTRYRCETEIDELVALARTYCEARARLEYAKAEGRVSLQEEDETREYLSALDQRIESLKSNNELVRSGAHARNNVIRLRKFIRRAVK